MQRLFYGLGVASVIGMTSGVQAAELSPEAADPLLIELHRQITIVGGASYLDYDESADGQASANDSGWLPEFGAQVGWLFDSGLFLEAGAAYSFGQTQLELSGPDTPRNERQTDNQRVSTYGKFGFSAAVNDRVLITPYLTYGYEHWQRELSFGVDTDRDYDTHFLGGGVMADIGIVHNLVGQIDVMGASTFANEQEIDPQVPGFDSVRFETGNAPLARVRLGLDYKLAPHFHVITGARYTYIARDEPAFSDVGDETRLPGYDSDTHEINLDAGFRFTF